VDRGLRSWFDLVVEPLCLVADRLILVIIDQPGEECADLRVLAISKPVGIAPDRGECLV
jgi:hypothetical protein